MDKKTYQHRIQIKKAQVYIRDHIHSSLNLEEIAKKAGASKYHFIRIFSAHTGETPLEYSRRQKVEYALKKIIEKDISITDIAFGLGFDSSSSLNKLFKKIIKMNPTEFRNLGKEQKDQIIYSISISKKMEEILMNLNITQEPEIIERAETSILFYEDTGSKFDEIAPPIWEKFLSILEEAKEDVSESEFFGISFTDDNEKYFYRAAISIPQGKSISISKLKQEKLINQKYAKFLLKGSYDGVWPAFDFAYKKINEFNFELADAPCLENYLNDPRETAEEDLLTEILIPIK